MIKDDFKALNISDYEKVKKCICGMFNNSESSFSTMYMWQHYADVKYYIDNGVLYSLFINKNGDFASFMPYGKYRNSVEVVDKIGELYQSLDSTVKINLCTEDFVEFLLKSNKYSIDVTECRNSFDYVYRTEDLINLSGRRYHSKKNHINSFRKKYSYDYCVYNESLKEKCLSFCKTVLKQHYLTDGKAFETEYLSISKTFDYIDEMNLKCGLLMLDDKIIALSVGERLNKDYALIHIEKADYEYRGAYSVINNLFLKNEFHDTKFVNREEDMGIEGLRIAKKSYHPCEMIKKYNVVFK